MRLIFIGPPGSGKGTQAQLLSQRLNLSHISTGEILREAVRQQTPAGKEAAPYMTAGQLVPDDLVNEIIVSRFRAKDRPDRFIMDGYPRTITQAERFDKVLQEQNLALTGVIYLAVDDQEIIRRLSGRKREDDAAATVRYRLEIFHNLFDGLVDHYRRRGLLIEVPGIDDIETIYKSIQTALDRKTAERG